MSFLSEARFFEQKKIGLKEAFKNALLLTKNINENVEVNEEIVEKLLRLIGRKKFIVNDYDKFIDSFGDNDFFNKEYLQDNNIKTYQVDNFKVGMGIKPYGDKNLIVMYHNNENGVDGIQDELFNAIKDLEDNLCYFSFNDNGNDLNGNPVDLPSQYHTMYNMRRGANDKHKITLYLNECDFEYDKNGQSKLYEYGYIKKPLNKKGDSDIVPLSETSLNRVLSEKHKNQGFIVLSAERPIDPFSRDGEYSGEDENDYKDISQSDNRKGTLLSKDKVVDSNLFWTEDNLTTFKGETYFKINKKYVKHATKSLKKDLSRSGFGYIPVYGGYQDIDGGTPAVLEASFVVYPQKKGKEANLKELIELGFELGQKYSQDSILIKIPNQAPAYYSTREKIAPNVDSDDLADTYKDAKDFDLKDDELRGRNVIKRNDKDLKGVGRTYFTSLNKREDTEKTFTYPNLYKGDKNNDRDEYAAVLRNRRKKEQSKKEKEISETIEFFNGEGILNETDYKMFVHIDVNMRNRSMAYQRPSSEIAYRYF